MANQSDTPRFTVVIATYARGDLIASTLSSVVNQSLAPHEILVVSDGPATPGLAVAVESVREARLIELPQRTRTQSGPNNEGWRQAGGDWIAYLGHDDIWHPEHLASLAQAIARRPGAGFAVSGLLYLGTEYDSEELTWVTGFFEDDDRRAPSEEFFPPSSFAHRRDLVGPNWPDINTITLPVDAEFLRSQAELGTEFVSTRRITVIKFASALRYLSYLVPDDAQQRWILALSANRAEFEEFLLARLEVSRSRGTFMHLKQVDRNLFVPGEIVERSEITRGINVGPLLPLLRKTWVPIGLGDRPPDWYPLESDATHQWRWSGPSITPKLLIPFTGPKSLPVLVGVRVLGFADEALREGIRVRVGGREVTPSWKAGVEGIMSFATNLIETGPTVIEILTQRTAPQRIANDRPVGIAVTGYELEPLPDLE